MGGQLCKTSVNTTNTNKSLDNHCSNTYKSIQRQCNIVWYSVVSEAATTDLEYLPCFEVTKDTPQRLLWELRRTTTEIFRVFYFADRIQFSGLYTTMYRIRALLCFLFYVRSRIMTSSNENIFRVTGPLWGESADHRWIPFTKASDAELLFSLICAWTNGWANTQDGGDLDTSALIMTSL